MTTGQHPSPTEIEHLRSLLQPHQVLTEREDLERYERSVLGDHRGSAAFVARPRTTEEVRLVVRWAFEHGVRLVPQGSNTGLVHAGQPDATGTVGVLSLELCKERLEVDVANRTLTASAGYDLDRLNDHLAEHHLFLPIDLGSSPAVGGMVSTNTGGTKMVHYGDVRARTLGLQVVLADEDATVLDMLSGLRKNNTGLDAKQLFVGTAGTYGVVTAATFELAPRPRQTATAWVVIPDDAAALQLLMALEAGAGELLTSYELISGSYIRMCKRHDPAMRVPLVEGSIPDMTVLVELSSTVPPAAGLSVESLLVSIIDDEAGQGHITDAVFGPPAEMWALRHRGGTEIQAEGISHWFDVSVPRSALPQFRSAFFDLVERAHPEWIAMVLGHYGDGGLHAGVVHPFSHGHPPDVVEAEAIRDAVYDLIHRLGGSFSAEHGVGPYNARFYHRYKDPALQELSGALKQLLDPRGILGVVDLGSES